jgi:SAM-dependent methyltransferase
VGCLVSPGVPDEAFNHPRLASIYDALDPDRGDLALYLRIAAERSARSVLDIGCGTGVLALLLAGRGISVTAVDPAEGSLNVARSKPGAPLVHWVLGTTADLPSMAVDLATMTGNVAQAIVNDTEWRSALEDVRGALRLGGTLALETRDPDRRAWEKWTREWTHRTVQIEDVGHVETWLDLLSVDGPLVTFQGTWRFESDGSVLVSTSTLRFRPKDEVADDLRATGFVLEDVMDAPDRPGLELVFIARRAR